MLFPRQVYPEILATGPVPGFPIELVLEQILSQWLTAELEPDACRSILERTVKSLPVADLFRVEGIDDGGMVATDALLFPSSSTYNLIFASLPDGSARLQPISASDMRALADGIRAASRSGRFSELRDRCGFLDEDLAALLTPDAGGVPAWPEVSGAGIQRREHASLVVQSETTRILIDPIYMNASLPHIPEAPIDHERKWDAILITHGHLDHWHLASLLYSARTSGTPIIVPEVPMTNLLSSMDFDAVLRSMGQEVIVARWGERITIGDIDIDVLPFYGEQPAPLAPGADPRVRNWGNCYRLAAPTFSTLVLTDSGADAAGDMREQVRKLTAAVGPTDVVLSSLRTIHCPFMEGLPAYWATLPFGRLRELFAMWQRDELPSATAGIEGVADICSVAGARYFLPQANGFAGIGEGIEDIGWGNGEPAEAACLDGVRERLGSRRADAEVLGWRVGDFASFPAGQRGELQVRAFSPKQRK